MAIYSLSGDEIRTALKELEQATFSHDQWAEMLFGTMICHLAPDERDLEPDSHRLCRFGQWYHSARSGGISRHPGFEQIGRNTSACTTMRRPCCGRPSSHADLDQDYERFVSALKRMRLEVATVQRELEDALFNLDPLTGTANRSGC